jgi:hypothetical protein
VKAVLTLILLIEGAMTAESGPDVYLFDYDAKAPLDFHDNSVQEVGGI